MPKFQSGRSYWLLTEGMDLHRGTGTEEHIVLNEPDVSGGGEHWMADVYIQFRHDYGINTYYLPKRDFWWQLPQRNLLAHDMFGGRSRIGSNGFPSVLMRRGEPVLSIRLPDDYSVFLTLVTGENAPAYSTDPRTKFVHRPFYSAQPSNEGRYLSGFLDLFSSLSFAHHILEQPYWRRMFNILSQQDPSKDQKNQERILNKLKEQIEARGANFLEKSGGLEWLSNQVIQLSKQQARTGKEQPFQTFIRELQKVVADWNSQRLGDQMSELNYVMRK
jgi:hypothetical protein